MAQRQPTRLKCTVYLSIGSYTTKKGPGQEEWGGGRCFVPGNNYGTVKPVLSDHCLGQKKSGLSIYRDGLLIEVKMYCKGTIGTRPSGRL